MFWDGFGSLSLSLLCALLPFRTWRKSAEARSRPTRTPTARKTPPTLLDVGERSLRPRARDGRAVRQHERDAACPARCLLHNAHGLLVPQRPKGHAGRWVAGAKLCGAVALFLLCIYVAIEGMARRCDEDQPLCGFLPWMRAPLPPPPPPLKQLELVTKDKRRAPRYCKAHPFEVAAAVGSVFLFDLFNVAVTVDRLDPVVRLAGFIGRPISRIARWVWRLGRRAQSADPGGCCGHSGQLRVDVGSPSAGRRVMSSDLALCDHSMVRPLTHAFKKESCDHAEEDVRTHCPPAGYDAAVRLYTPREPRRTRTRSARVRR